MESPGANEHACHEPTAQAARHCRADDPARPPAPVAWLAWWLPLCLFGMAVVYAGLYGLIGDPTPPTVQLRCVAHAVLFPLYFVTVWLLVRAGPAACDRGNLLLVLAGAALLRLVILSGAVPDNPDLGRHLWEGRVLLEGFNPYAAAPADGTYDPLRDRLATEGDPLYSGEWLHYAHVRSVYGPVATALFALPHLLPLDRVLCLRLIMTCLDFLTVLLLVRLARSLNLAPSLVAVYAWNPVCLNSFADRGQVDAALVFLTVLATLWALRRRPTVAGLAFAAALLTKLSPVLLFLPLLRISGRPFALACLAALLVGVFPFAGAGPEGLQGFIAFADQWRDNDSVYSLLLLTLGPLDGLLDTARAARLLVALAALLYALLVAARLDPARPQHLVRALASISAAVILLSPVIYPWYATSLLAFLCFWPRASLLALSTVPMLWFLQFLTAPATSPWHIIVAAGRRWRQPWRLPAYAAVAVIYLWELRTSHRPSSATDHPTPTTAS